MRAARCRGAGGGGGGARGCRSSSWGGYLGDGGASGAPVRLVDRLLAAAEAEGDELPACAGVAGPWDGGGLAPVEFSAQLSDRAEGDDRILRSGVSREGAEVGAHASTVVDAGRCVNVG